MERKKACSLLMCKLAVNHLGSSAVSIRLANKQSSYLSIIFKIRNCVVLCNSVVFGTYGHHQVLSFLPSVPRCAVPLLQLPSVCNE